MAVTEVDNTSGMSLEYTPTWVVAVVCFCIVFISITVEELFHCAGQYLKKKKKSESWPLVDGSRKIKDELMLLGLISLLLTVFQSSIRKICISEQLDNILLPCKKPNPPSAVANFNTSSFASSATRGRRLLAVASDTTDYCSEKRIQWGRLGTYDKEIGSADKQKQGEELAKILEHNKKPSRFFSYMVVSNMEKSIYSLTKEEYIALRLNFITACDPKDAGKDFQKYILWILEKEFEKMIEINWYSWFLTVIYMLMNVAGWNAYFWISFIPFTILLIVGLRLEFMISRLIKWVAENHRKNENASSENGAKGTVYKFTNNYRCFRFVDILIHIMLFLNSLELAFFFFMLIQYGFHSCIMENVGFVVSRIVMGGCLQILCMSRILPLYAIMKSQMHLEQQLDKHNKIREIKIYLEEYLSNEHVKKCLDELDEIKTQLKEKQMDEEEEMQIPTWISELIDHRKNQREQPNSPEESTNTELAGRSGAGDIEAQN
ncbi:hypothetical protein ACJRO7_000314 [Eucalyptus globulus]|uniref:MLO-like protein n=1 Tax=Eucalyptus globulus TaxID=34317 RepID=A0ABD3LWZ7_EUCGL